jgi:nucleotide-binding universal stress UspA family protein
MNPFSNTAIIAPIDFSEEADRAVEMGFRFASRPEMVTVIHVATPLITFEPVSGINILSDDERRAELEAALRKRYRDRKFGGVNFEVRFGDPGHEIVGLSKEIKAGLIVMTSHGRTGLAHVLLGSVAERVVRLAHCPVLVLRR